jgi:type I restriction-modification system DNA methylase subunit
MTIESYLAKVDTRFRTGISTEHSYRGDLQELIGSLCPDILVTNEPTRIKCGAPDYILTRNTIPVSYIEAKDIGDPDLQGKKGNKEQFDRYKATKDPFIFTDYLEFHFYKDEKLVTSVTIGAVDKGKVIGVPSKYQEFKNLIKGFSQQTSQTIKSAERLSKMMAGKARLMKDVFQKTLESDLEDDLNPDTALQQQFSAFKDVLIHDITPKDFADIYAQTIAYGMFAARLHDTTLEDFSRQEAMELIPKTNPFLRKLFQYVAVDLDDRIIWIVDSLVDIFNATDVSALLKDFGKSTAQHDPIIHFYETFLGEYDSKLRKARGVWYTPEPVVNFIVRAVDDILKEEFGLKAGLADTSKTKVKIKIPTHDKRFKAGQRDYEQEFHKVQILDPATGTGTFLAEVIKQNYKKFKGQEGIWNQYVEKDLLPRLNGFEI